MPVTTTLSSFQIAESSSFLWNTLGLERDASILKAQIVDSFVVALEILRSSCQFKTGLPTIFSSRLDCLCRLRADVFLEGYTSPRQLSYQENTIFQYFATNYGWPGHNITFETTRSYLVITQRPWKTNADWSFLIAWHFLNYADRSVLQYPVGQSDNISHGGRQIIRHSHSWKIASGHSRRYFPFGKCIFVVFNSFNFKRVIYSSYRRKRKKPSENPLHRPFCRGYGVQKSEGGSGLAEKGKAAPHSPQFPFSVSFLRFILHRLAKEPFIKVKFLLEISSNCIR